MTCGVGGVRYHTGRTLVKLEKLRVSIMGVLTMPKYGNIKVICWMGVAPH